MCKISLLSTAVTHSLSLSLSLSLTFSFFIYIALSISLCLYLSICLSASLSLSLSLLYFHFPKENYCCTARKLQVLFHSRVSISSLFCCKPCDSVRATPKFEFGVNYANINLSYRLLEPILWNTFFHKNPNFKRKLGNIFKKPNIQYCQ